MKTTRLQNRWLQVELRSACGRSSRGLAVDVLGRTYVAAWGTGQIWRIDPATSERLLVALHLPVARHMHRSGIRTLALSFLDVSIISSFEPYEREPCGCAGQQEPRNQRLPRDRSMPLTEVCDALQAPRFES